MRVRSVSRLFYTLHVDLTLAAAYLGEIVIKLHSKPRFRSAAESLGEPHGDFGGNAALPSQQVIEGLAGDSKRLGGLGDGQP
jgi:hypothetical protein